MGTRLSILDKNLHEVTVADRHYIFHIPSTGLFERDGLTKDILSSLRSGDAFDDATLVEHLAGKYHPEDVDSALSELKSLALVSDGTEPDQSIQELNLETVPLNTVVLNVNTGCNLSCTYCYKEDLDEPANGKRMSFKTAKDSVEMLLKESPDQDRYNMVFFGGEPLTNLTLIKEVVQWAESRFKRIGKRVDFSLTTNATLLNEKVIDYLHEHNIGIAVSMDGPESYHNRNRITVGGKGTYATVVRKVRMLLARYSARPVGARVTLTRGITDVEAIWNHLFNDLGFHEVGFAPVTSGDISDFNLTDTEVAEVFANLKSLGRRYLRAALEGRSIGFSNMHQMLTDIHEGTKKALPCGAGVGMVAIDHEGGVNLCHRFTGSDLPLFGDIESGLDKPALNKFLNQRLAMSEKGCDTCRIRNLCAGGCYHESYARYGDPVRPTWHYCDLMRDWVDFCIEVYTEILEKNPEFFNRFLTPRRAMS